MGFMLHHVFNYLRSIEKRKREKEKEIFRQTEIRSHKKNEQEIRAKNAEFKAALIPLSINTKHIYQSSQFSPNLLNFTSTSDKTMT